MFSMVIMQIISSYFYQVKITLWQCKSWYDFQVSFQAIVSNSKSSSQEVLSLIPANGECQKKRGFGFLAIVCSLKPSFPDYRQTSENSEEGCYEGVIPENLSLFRWNIIGHMDPILHAFVWTCAELYIYSMEKAYSMDFIHHEVFLFSSSHT